MAFDEEVGRHLIRIPNRPDIFGDQLILDENDEVIGTLPDLLSNATDISVDEADSFAAYYGGVCYPAHIDRQANGIIAVLGDLPPNEKYTCVELHDGSREEEFRRQYRLDNSVVVVGSDAHYLWDIRDKEHFIEIDDEPYSSALVRKNLIDKLRRGV
jgi:hypothetical protein